MKSVSIGKSLNQQHHRKVGTMLISLTQETCLIGSHVGDKIRLGILTLKIPKVSVIPLPGVAYGGLNMPLLTFKERRHYRKKT